MENEKRVLTKLIDVLAELKIDVVAEHQQLIDNLIEQVKLKEEQEKKRNKGWVFVIDRASVPSNMKMLECIDKENKTICWDSSLGGQKPQLINLGGDENEDRQYYKIVDLANKPNE